MKIPPIVSIIILLLAAGIAIAFVTVRGKQVATHNAAVSKANAAIDAEDKAADSSMPAPVETASPAPVVATPGFVSPTPAAKEDQLKLADELVAKAGELWKQGKKLESIAAGDAALAMYEAQYGERDDRTVKLKVQLTRAKLEMMAPPDRKKK